MINLDIVKQLSEELGVSERAIKEAYKGFFEFIRERVTSLPLKENLTEEEFNQLKTNFNIPSLGKLHCTYDRYLAVNSQSKYIKKLKEEYEDKEH